MLFSKLLPFAGALAVGGAAASGGYLLQAKAQEANALLAFGKPPDGGESPIPLMERVPTRAAHLAKLRAATAEHPFDFLIIGGGATGTGCAVDAATRGLKTALVERGDFGSGTSSKSTKLVHGGVRYLEKAVWKLDYGQLHLVFEALQERSTLLQNAAHLAHALPIITPCYKWWEIPYYWAGMKAYDLVAWSHGLVPSRYVGLYETMALLPTLAAKKEDGTSLKGSILYYDGQFNDARVNVALACTAAAVGASITNYVECKKLIKNSDGKVIGARVYDKQSGEELDVHARVVINATGPFSDNIRRQSDPSATPSILPSSGAHVTLPAYYGSLSSGLLVPKTKDGRIVFLLPWLDHVIAGTTDTNCEVHDNPVATDDEVTFILETLTEYLGLPVRRGDVLSTWSGIRPLAIDPHNKDTASTSRDHVIMEEPDGMITVAGGKWTTYRRMAELVVDAAVASGRMPLNTGPCRSRDLRLVGAVDYHSTLSAEVAQRMSDNAELQQQQLAASQSAPPSSSPSQQLDSQPAHLTGETIHNIARHLTEAYGDRATRVLQVASEHPILQRPLSPGYPILQAEVLYCVRNEYCMHVEDFLARRTRLAFLDAHAAKAAISTVAELMGAELGWSAEQARSEVAAANTFLDTFSPVHAPGLAATGGSSSRQGDGSGDSDGLPEAVSRS